MFILIIQCSCIFQPYILAVFRELQALSMYTVQMVVIHEKLPHLLCALIKLMAPEDGQDVQPKCVGALYNKYKHCTASW